MAPSAYTSTAVVTSRALAGRPVPEPCTPASRGSPRWRCAPRTRPGTWPGRSPQSAARERRQAAGRLGRVGPSCSVNASRMFAGLRSRCNTPRAWACWTARARAATTPSRVLPRHRRGRSLQPIGERNPGDIRRHHVGHAFRRPATRAPGRCWGAPSRAAACASTASRWPASASRTASGRKAP